VIEARFDDLTGASASFRLREPVGVVEATRLDEVVPTLAAAEGAARRGLWVAGFVAYEAAPGLDPALTVRQAAPDDPFAAFPLAWFAMFERRDETALPEPQHDPDPGGAWTPTTDRERYDGAVATIRARIAAGDTYQVNHTLRLRAQVTGDPRGLYRDLCYAQRGAYAAYLNLGRYAVASASPELFFELRDGRLTTRPMKGTAPRGRWTGEDEFVAAGLRGSVKDRAENAMIVDLLRNDLGRIARAGSVSWSDVFELERFETVWQLTSTVSADVAAPGGLADVFRALFPCGSVTGAPKVETMRIIAALEDSPRGVYCGAVGYLSPPGSGLPAARFNVPIRTVVVDGRSGVAEYGVGGGITWDSSAAAEYDEVVAKARVLVARRPRFTLFETLHHDPADGYRHLDRHLARLRSSATYFGFAWDEDGVRAALDAEAERHPEEATRIRLELDRRGVATTGGMPLARTIEPVRVAIDTDEPVDPAEPLLYHKTSLRRRYEEARARHPDADDVLLTNTLGDVTESTIANVAVRGAHGWRTPPLEAGLLPGIGRAIAIEEGRVVEAPCPIRGVREAGEIALVSDLRGWRRAEIVET